MPWWLSSIGAVIAGLATFVIGWSALKPRQRLFATKFTAKWMNRAFMAYGVGYFVWMNWMFLAKDSPVTRLELWLFILVVAEAIVLGLIVLLVKFFSRYVKEESERYVRLLGKIEEVYKRSDPAGQSANPVTDVRQQEESRKP